MTSTLRRAEVALLLMALLGPAACGSSTDNGSDGGNDGGNSACTIALTGAQTGSYDCASVLAIFASDSSLSAVDFSTSTGSPVVNVALRFPGELTTKTYRSTDAGAVGSVVVNLNNMSAWIAVVDPSSQTPIVGSFVLTISSVSTLSSDANGKVLRVHGSLTATLPSLASTAATGTVTVNATF
jgi:hypothetical protein